MNWQSCWSRLPGVVWLIVVMALLVVAGCSSWPLVDYPELPETGLDSPAQGVDMEVAVKEL